MNITTKILISQYEKLTQQELSQLFLADPYTWVVYNLNEQEKRLFDLLIWADNNLQFSRFSQSQLADKLGTTRENINRVLAKFKRFGLVAFKQLGYNMPCIYKLNSYFRTINARDCLQHLFPSIKKIIFKFTHSFLTNSKKSHYVLELIKNFIPNVIHNNVIHNVTHKSYNSSTAQHREGTKTMTFEEKRRVLERMKNGENGISPITPSIDGFKSLQLTVAGMVDLTAYTDEIVAYADNVLSKKHGYNNFDNPFGYVIRICRNRSAELGLPVQGRFAHELREFYKIELNAPKHQPIARTLSGSNSSQPIQRQKTQDHQGDKQAFNAHVETMTSDEIRTEIAAVKAAIDQEFAKGEARTSSTNPNQLICVDGNVVLTLRKHLEVLEKRLATLEGERPYSLPNPSENYQRLKAMQPPSSTSFFGESLADLFKRNLANAQKACQDYCGNDMSVAPAAPPSQNGPEIDYSDTNLEEVYELPGY